MKILKKMLCGVMAAVMMITALCVPASAANDYDSAKLVDSGKKVTFTCKFDKNQYGYYTVECPKIYKVEVSKKGTLKLDLVSANSSLHVDVINGDGTELLMFDESEATSGKVVNYSNTGTECWWDRNLQKAKVTLKYKVEKGTYYVKVWAPVNAQIEGKTSISFTYPQAEKKTETAEITSFEITLKKGNTLQLGAILSGEGDVKWSTSKKSVATVSSKGKITAKAKGTAVITAKVGDSSRKITIKVS